MDEATTMLDLVLHLASSILACYINLLRDFLRFSRKCFTLITVPNHVEEDDTDHYYSEGEQLSEEDIKVVIGRLGIMLGPAGGGGRGAAEYGGGGVLEALLEEKKASMEELREAFYVFDRNEDGFISPGELWCVMRRLGLQEGLRLEECERMIGVFDEDGDGRISFSEFVGLMENAS
ncbi:calmodulin-like protein 7 [Canna indica]|uniref:Calmodulin-like protein 7 n=1 Tax=Canna indica TaxID=4628 RepID=A0AAQ3QME7_9LILI|nr:calmodulin-like protein 7 [Canna indica]